MKPEMFFYLMLIYVMLILVACTMAFIYAFM